MAKDANSLTGGKGFAVAPSPLNVVKLDLGVILAVGALLLLVQGRIVDSLPLQLVLLATYGLLGMIWVVVRTRKVIAQLARDQEQQHSDAPQ